MRTPGRMRAGEHPNQMRPAPGEEKKENWRKPVSPYHAARDLDDGGRQHPANTLQPTASKSQKKRHCEISAPDIPRIIPRGMSGARSLRARWCGNPVDLPGVFQRAASLFHCTSVLPPHIQNHLHSAAPYTAALLTHQTQGRGKNSPALRQRVEQASSPLCFVQFSELDQFRNLLDGT